MQQIQKSCFLNYSAKWRGLWASRHRTDGGGQKFFQKKTHDDAIGRFFQKRFQRRVILSSLLLTLSTNMERFVSRWSIWRMVNGCWDEAMSMVVLPAFVPRT